MGRSLCRELEVEYCRSDLCGHALEDSVDVGRSGLYYSYNCLDALHIA